MDGFAFTRERSTVDISERLEWRFDRYCSVALVLTGSLMLFLVSLKLDWVFGRTRSLLLVVSLHATNNITILDAEAAA
jgi:hypothetical protein